MKQKTFLFLFFCVLFFIWNPVLSQQKKDSLDYYVALLKKSKDKIVFTEAYKYLKGEKKRSLKENDILRAVYVLSYISRVQYDLGIYYDCESTAIEGLTLLDSLPGSTYKNHLKPAILNQLGILKRTLRQYKKSFEYYSQTLELAQKKTDSVTAYNNIGVAYNYLKQYQQAIIVLKKAYAFSLEVKDSIKIALVLDNLGYAQSMSNDTAGLKNMLEALRIRKVIRDKDMYNSYKHLAEYHNFKGETKKALDYAKLGYAIAKEDNNLPLKKDALSNLIDLKEYSYTNEFKKVIEEQDSIRLINGHLFAEAKYDYTKEQSLRRQSEAREERNLLLVIAVSIIALFFIYTLIIQHKKGKLKILYDTERRIAKTLHDEVANDLYYMMNKLQTKSQSKKEIADKLEEIYLKIRDISKANTALDVSHDFENLLKDLIISYKTATVNILPVTISEIPWKSISNFKKEALYRVIQELMTNMKKHSQATVVTLQFEMQHKKVVVIYTDNGVGCDLIKGNGLQNAENRMELAGGTIIFESETGKGFQAKLMV